SDRLFQNSIVSCGRCIQIHSVSQMAVLNEELTEVVSSPTQQDNFTVMVMDQCTDPICMEADGFLDFDVYTMTPPSTEGNPRNLYWDFVECPVFENEFIEFMIEVVASSSTIYYLAMYPRNHRNPIRHLTFSGEDMLDEHGWKWFDAIQKDENHFVSWEGLDSPPLVLNFSTVEWDPSQKHPQRGLWKTLVQN
ncbi:hypothetical protein EBS02_09165, partial [bacterium]|nr:hypothetical protein [bacterium]